MRFGRPPRAPEKANLQDVAKRLADPWEPSDRERLVAEWRAQGATDDDVAKLSAEEDEAETVRVLPCNMETVRVYCRCAWDVEVAPMSGTIIHKGITAQEIEAACNLLRVPEDRRGEVSEGVRIMANAAGPILNKKSGKGSGSDDDFQHAARGHA